jgi:hypothetical protein
MSKIYLVKITRYGEAPGPAVRVNTRSLHDLWATIQLGDIVQAVRVQ